MASQIDQKALQTHIKTYLQHTKSAAEKYRSDSEERAKRVEYYRGFSKRDMLAMDEDTFAEYVSNLWAMLIWGNKQYCVDKLIADNGFDKLKKELADLVWGKDAVDKRWDRFRKAVKGVGPAMMSEILCHVHSDECMLWNRRAFVGFQALGVPNLPVYNYQLTGKRYKELSEIAKVIAGELRTHGIPNANLLTVDYFIWDELQSEESLGKAVKGVSVKEAEAQLPADETSSAFIHDEIRDKLSDIGEWLGFKGRTEVKVADGSKVDTVWEATIGNMGRTIYVFEVQTKGSIDSLLMNLLKSLNNPAVQGIVAVSDAAQIEKIRKHAASIPQLSTKLRFWDYLEVLQVHEDLSSVNESINSLGLVPESF